jgi:hypothetical protein
LILIAMLPESLGLQTRTIVTILFVEIRVLLTSPWLCLELQHSWCLHLK